MPSTSTLVQKAALVQVRITRRERTRWGDAARQAEMNLSEFVRDAVRQQIIRCGPVGLSSPQRDESR